MNNLALGVLCALVAGCCTTRETIVRVERDTLYIPDIMIIDNPVEVVDSAAYVKIDSLLGELDKARGAAQPSVRHFRGENITERADTVRWDLVLTRTGPLMSLSVRHAPVVELRVDTVVVTRQPPDTPFWKIVGAGLVIFMLGGVVGFVITLALRR